MKKTILAMILTGSSIAMFAQTTTPTSPTTSPKTNPSTTSPTTSPATSPSTSPTTSPSTNPSTTTPSTNNPSALPSNPGTTQPSSNTRTYGNTINSGNTTNTNVTNSTSDPVSTPTNSTLTNSTNNNGTNNNWNNGTTNSNWNNGSSAPMTWGNYGIWDNSTNGVMSSSSASGTMNANGTANGNMSNNSNGSSNSSNSPNSSTSNSSYNQGSSYNSVNTSSAYGAAVTSVPYNVQTNYSKNYPTAASSNGTWNQYGDWFYTTNMNNGRYSQIYYDNRGNGYSLALPVLNTFVPENVVSQALQKYGSNLYSITALKTANGSNTYQINLLNRGQVKMEWVGDDGAAAQNVYRMDVEGATLNASQTNAAMDNSSSTNTPATSTTADSQLSTSTSDFQDTTRHPNSGGKKLKSKTKNSDGTVTKVVAKPNGQTKVKTKQKGMMRRDHSSTDSTSTNNQQ